MRRASLGIPSAREWQRIAVWLATSFAAHAALASPVLFSPDISVRLGTGSVTIDQNRAASDNGAGTVAIPSYLSAMFSAIPASAQIADFELSGSPSVGWLLAVDTTLALPGLPAGSPAEPRDVVRFDRNTGNYSLFFDGSANGIPDGVQIDARDERHAHPGHARRE
jgi:hypothetical protein